MIQINCNTIKIIEQLYDIYLLHLITRCNHFEHTCNIYVCLIKQVICDLSSSLQFSVDIPKKLNKRLLQSMV
jgi:hypothetical protein